MFTPGIGPATEGLKGLELFCASHPGTASIKAAESAAAAALYVVVIKCLGLVSRTVCSGRQPRADTLSAGDTHRFSEAGVLGVWSTSSIDAHFLRVKVRPADGRLLLLVVLTSLVAAGPNHYEGISCCGQAQQEDLLFSENGAERSLSLASVAADIHEAAREGKQHDQRGTHERHQQC